MLRFLIVGSGYRSKFYGRIASRYPGLFEALFLCRSQEKAELVERETRTRGTCSEAQALSFCPDFVVVAVDKQHISQVSEEWARRGFPVLMETPAGFSMEELFSLWKLNQEVGGRLSCAEQYLRYPIVSQGKKLIEQGLIGEPKSLYLSLAHDYHGFSLIRGLLGAGMEEVEIHFLKSECEMLETDSRQGATYEGRLQKEQRLQALLSFSSGKSCVYDFASPQYHSFIRSRHLILRGDRGEWNDRFISYVDDQMMPGRCSLMPEPPLEYRDLDCKELQELRKIWSPEISMENVQDEFAMATLLKDMEGCCREGKEPPYPMREALQDTYLWLLIDQMKTQGGVVTSQRMPWNE